MHENDLIWQVGHPWCDLLALAREEDYVRLTMITEHGTMNLFDLEEDKFMRIPHEHEGYVNKLTGDEKWGHYYNLGITPCGATFHQYGIGLRASTHVLALAGGLRQPEPIDDEWLNELQGTERDDSTHPEGLCGAYYCINRPVRFW